MVFQLRVSDSKFSQISSSLADISLDGLHSYFYFHILQFLYQSFGYCCKCSNRNWYHRHFHAPQFFQFSSKGLVIICLITFIQFSPVVSRKGKVRYSAGTLFFFYNHLVWPLAGISLSVCISKSHCPVGWGCRIHRLLLCRGVRPHPRVSWILYKTI